MGPGDAYKQRSKLANYLVEKRQVNLQHAWGVWHAGLQVFQITSSIQLPHQSSPFRPPSSSFNYWRAIGLLGYLVKKTRPDLAHAYIHLLQCLNKPMAHHQQSFSHLFPYLGGSSNLGLTLGGEPSRHGHSKAMPMRRMVFQWTGKVYWDVP